jgi:hypothetical protein
MDALTRQPGHSTSSNPATIAEVQGILLVQLKTWGSASAEWTAMLWSRW